MIIIIEKSKNYFNNNYESISPVQEERLTKKGLPKFLIKALDKSLWATLTGDFISKYLTVYEAVELAAYVEKYKKLPLIEPLKTSLREELGIVC